MESSSTSERALRLSRSSGGGRDRHRLEWGGEPSEHASGAGTVSDYAAGSAGSDDASATVAGRAIERSSPGEDGTVAVSGREIDGFGGGDADAGSVPGRGMDGSVAPDGDGAAVPDRAVEGSATADFFVAFDAFAQAVRRARGAPAHPEDPGLTLSQYGLLESLGTRHAARVQELAAYAGITPSTATRILDALERRGIVRRTRSSEDRRAVAVSLTEMGQELLGAQRDWLRGRQRAFYASLPPAEQDLAPDLLLRLAALIDELATGRAC